MTQLLSTVNSEYHYYWEIEDTQQPRTEAPGSKDSDEGTRFRVITGFGKVYVHTELIIGPGCLNQNI